MNIKHIFMILLRIAFVFLCVVFFPLGIFTIGYVIGNNRGKKSHVKITQEFIRDDDSDENKEDVGVLVI